MEQIVVKHPDGTTALLSSRANSSGITKAEQSIALLGADTVAITVKSAIPLTFCLGDQIDVHGKTYTLNQLPGIKKTGKRNFEYTLTFEGVQYELIDVQFLLPDDTVLDSFTGDLEDFLGILIGNLTRVYPGKWVLGVFPANTEYKTLTYTEKNCLEVLQDLCEQFSTEFEITQANGVRTLNIKTAGVNFPYTFRYGRTGGLYELTRQNINSKNVVTRLYVYGGSSNLGDKYRYSRLCLPGKAKNASYIENAAAIAAYGIKENTKVYDTIQPERYGKVTAAGSKYYAFKDATMSFDLNEKDSEGNTKWLIAGVNAKVKFTTGGLAGYEFDVHKYDHTTKEIQVVPFTDENGMKFPSETSAAFQFGVDDTYFFTDINLPDAYKTDAENRLLSESTKELTQYSQPQVQYGLSIDQNFIRQFAGELTVVNLFAVGDYIPVEDEDIGVNKSVRITAFTRDLLQEYKYYITLGDSVTKTTITRVIEDLQKIDNVIEINDLGDPSKARRNWRASQEVLANVFDPEGNYYSEKIKPLSIETTMLATGARSQQFVLQNTRFEPNYEGNPNTVKVVGGTLVHDTIADTVKSWQLNTATFSNLVSGTVYNIYARCQRTGTAGNIVFDTVQRKVDGDPIYYYFLVGSLSSVIADSDGSRAARLISLTYGGSMINGRFITTGRIQSNNSGCYIDLDENKFRIGDSTSYLDWNIIAPGTLTTINMILENATIKNKLSVLGEALLAGFYFSDEVIKSTMKTGTEPAMYINGKTAKIHLKSPNTGGDYSLDYEASDIDIDASKGEISARNDSGLSYLSASGIFCNNAKTNAMPASSGYTHYGSIVGLGFGNVNNNWMFDKESTLIAGVYGRANNIGTAPAYGGYFRDLMAAGLIFNPKYIGDDATIYLSDTYTQCLGLTNSGKTATVYLPTGNMEGKVIFAKQIGQGQMRFRLRAGQFIFDDISANDYYDVPAGWEAKFTFAIFYLNSVKKEAWFVSRWKF